MNNYTDYYGKKQGFFPATWIYFKFSTGTGIEWYDYKLPYPNYLLHTNQGYFIGWLVNGNESKYTEELRARFIQTFQEFTPKVIEDKPKATAMAHTSPTIHNLKEFNVLQSLKTKAVNISRVETLFTNDETFWHLKFYCEYLIKRDNIPSYIDLERFAYNTYPNKCQSTLKAKARSIYNWYSERDFKCGRATKKYKNMKEYQELNMATRKEQAKKMHKKLANDTKKKVYNLIGGMFKDEYKKKNGNWNVSKIAKESGTSRNTVYKYITDFEAL
jgi:hypothetical protein